MIYKVKPCSAPMAIDADWEKPAWKNIPSISLQNYMGPTPAHRPETHVKMAYDANAVYLIFQVHDHYVRSTWTNYQEDVWQDSCVEFFFTPNTEATGNYFNLETNCGGTALFAFQTGPREGEIRIPEEEFKAITLAHSRPKTTLPETNAPTSWTLEYRLPWEILKKYTAVTPPVPGTTWKANFYKIADETSHPHYLTWAPVNAPEPDFHLPSFFGTLEFE